MLHTEIVNEPDAAEKERLDSIQKAWDARKDDVFKEKTDEKLPELKHDESMQVASFCT